MHRTLFAGASALALAATSFASFGGGVALQLNEVYISHAGTDDQEYVEVRGAAGTSLDNVVVLIVEGEGASAGTLDRVWDFTGFTLPDDGGGIGYGVIGGTAVANLDVDVGATNIIENGTETIYLLTVTDVAAVSALLGTGPDANGDCSILDDLGALVVTVHDIVAPVDGNLMNTDLIFDNAPPVGPDGTFFPAGIFRDGDAPNPWCSTSFLDFDDIANLDQPRTPGAANTAVCAAGDPGVGDCFGNGCPCANDDGSAGCMNSAGLGGLLSGSGTNSVGADDLQLNATGLPRFQNGLFMMGDKANLPVTFFDGLQCVGGNTFRFLGSVQNSGNLGTMTYTGLVAAAGGLISAGEAWYFVGWYRDWPDTPCGTQANLTNAYVVIFAP